MHDPIIDTVREEKSQLKKIAKAKVFSCSLKGSSAVSPASHHFYCSLLYLLVI
jgi:hypothetical protein